MPLSYLIGDSSLFYSFGAPDEPSSVNHQKKVSNLNDPHFNVQGVPTKDNVDESSEGGENYLYEEYKGYEEIVEHIIEDVEV